MRCAQIGYLSSDYLIQVPYVHLNHKCVEREIGDLRFHSSVIAGSGSRLTPTAAIRYLLAMTTTYRTDMSPNELNVFGSSSLSDESSQQFQSSQAQDTVPVSTCPPSKGDGLSTTPSELQLDCLPHSGSGQSSPCLSQRTDYDSDDGLGGRKRSSFTISTNYTKPTSDTASIAEKYEHSSYTASIAGESEYSVSKFDPVGSNDQPQGDHIHNEAEVCTPQASLSPSSREELERAPASPPQQMSPSLTSPQTESEVSSSTEDNDLLVRVNRRNLLLDRLMNYFFISFSSCHSPFPSLRATACGTGSTGSDGNPTHVGTSSMSSSLTSEVLGNRGISKRKRVDDNENEGHGPNDDERGKRPRVGDPSPRPRRLACPYFKKDPIRFQTKQSCCGPGWETVHRLKEHLDRRHALPISCRRCYTAFNTEAEHDSHIRSFEQCEVQQQPCSIEGFNAGQRAELKSRPRGLKHMSEPQKWRRVYLILFPETSENEVPSPYYEFQTLSDPGHPQDPMMEYEEYLQRELPSRVREQLEIRIEEALDPIEETLRGQIVEIVRDMQLELFRLFRSSIRQPDRASTHGAERVEAQGRMGEQQPEEPIQPLWANNTSLQSVQDVEVQLAALRPEPYLDWDFDDFDGQLFDFGQVTRGTGEDDSAYGTGIVELGAVQTVSYETLHYGCCSMLLEAIRPEVLDDSREDTVPINFRSQKHNALSQAPRSPAPCRRLAKEATPYPVALNLFPNMSGRFVRASKYRHVFGKATRKEFCYDNLRISRNAWDTNLIKANPEFLAVNWEASGGGAFAVIPLEERGKIPDVIPLFRGHTATVLDTDWNPFNDRVIASASDDGKVMLWQVPLGFSLFTDAEEPTDVSPVAKLTGHSRKVGQTLYRA
ncbi:hypothetical protein O1611_g7920 [Lasiodiplodia mahajangana]|uniref:Uncharacterized protein n=1 Tax=Lasiodiplodia mahajangana TaxID=1108764 RepID=A0ACC2JE25_9PEZI|nr:hypothetical protein O1611_g7920 [Lasiodiplodia mahajangana]